MPGRIRNHYIPQHYLRRFVRPDVEHQIWVYDKLLRREFVTSVARAARETGFYHDAMEEALATRIEAPAEELIQAVCEGRRLAPEQKRQLALFVSMMSKRVPAYQQRAQAMIQRWPGIPGQPGGPFKVDSLCLIMPPALECTPPSGSCHGPDGSADVRGCSSPSSFQSAGRHRDRCSSRASRCARTSAIATAAR